MQELKILNSREIKEILKLIEAQWGVKPVLNFAFLKNNHGRVFIINKEIKDIDLSKLRINTIGMYFCEIDDKGIRLSIEGSQIIGPKAEKNIAEINEAQCKQWLRGEDLEIKEGYSKFVILKHKDDFFGTGKYKDGKILNYVNKGRRVNAI